MATLEDVTEGPASVPCSEVGPRTSEEPSQGRTTKPAGHARLPMTSQLHTPSTKATHAPTVCPEPKAGAHSPALLPTIKAQIIPKVSPDSLHLQNIIEDI